MPSEIPYKNPAFIGLALFTAAFGYLVYQLLHFDFEANWMLVPFVLLAALVCGVGRLYRLGAT